ncbi:MAG TPA: PAS domain S-box protein [bacterium]|nr:PAS domain S-box protein [bacterium]
MSGSTGQTNKHNAKIGSFPESIGPFFALNDELMDLIPVCVCAFSPEGRIIFLNQAAREFLDTSLGNARGREWFEFVADDQRQGIESAFLAGVKLSESFSLAFKIKTGVQVRTRFRVMSGKADQETMVLAAATEISELAAADSGQSAKSEFLAKVINSASEGIIILDDQFRYIMINPAGSRMLEMKPKDLIGKQAGSKVHPDDREKVSQALQKALAGEPMAIEARIADGRDSYRLLQINLTPLTWAGKRHLLGMVFDITEQKLSHKALEKSETRYRLFAENISDIVYTVDMNLNMTYVSPSVERVLGFTVEQALAQSPEQQMTPESVQRVVKIYLEEIDKESRGEGDPFRSRTFEIEQYKKDGATIWTEENISFIRDAQGKAVGIQGISRDITGRRKAEAAMREAEARYTGLFNSSHDAVYLCDFSGNFLDANEAALRMLGYSRQEIKGLNFASLLDEKQLPAAIDSTRELLETGKMKDMQEYRLRRKDESHIDVQSFGSMVYKEGKPYCIQGIARDVTEDRALLGKLKSLSRQLNTEHQKLRSMIDNMEEVVVMADAEDVIRDINPLGERFFGISRDQIIGRKLFDFHLPVVAARVKELLESFKAGQQEFYSIKRQISDKWLDLRVSRISAPDGAYQGVIFNVIDVTSLVEARQKAEEMSLAKSRFLANMSHEIRTPMNGILGFSELLMNTPLNAKQGQYVDTIMKSGEHLLGLINQILDLSRIEAGKVVIEKRTLQPELLAREALEMVRPQAEKKGLELALSISPDLPENLVADDKKLLQVLVNLAGNAVKFTEQGRVEIMLRPDGKDELALSVRDTGPGIPRSQRERIFEAFEQVEGGMGRSHQGTGLGLAISRKLVEAMGGRLELESEMGKGSVFTASVPVETPGNQECDTTRSETPAAEESRRERPARILIIDDEEEVVEVVRRMVEHFGLSAHGESCGRAGIEWAREHQPDAILLDINLPDLSGWEVMDQLKKDPATSNIPVIVQTVQDEQIQGASRAAAWITKPFTMDMVERTLQKAGIKANKNGGPQDREPDPGPIPKAGLVLLVDDNLTNRELVRGFLEGPEWSVIEAESGEECLARARANHPDIILLDIALPGMHGLDVARHLRRDPETRDAFIIALTAVVVGADEEKCRAAGCDEYIRKPFKKSELLQKMNRPAAGPRPGGEQGRESDEQLRC